MWRAPGSGVPALSPLPDGMSCRAPDRRRGSLCRHRGTPARSTCRWPRDSAPATGEASYRYPPSAAPPDGCRLRASEPPDDRPSPRPAPRRLQVGSGARRHLARHLRPGGAGPAPRRLAPEARRGSPLSRRLDAPGGISPRDAEPGHCVTASGRHRPSPRHDCPKPCRSCGWSIRTSPRRWSNMSSWRCWPSTATCPSTGPSRLPALDPAAGAAAPSGASASWVSASSARPPRGLGPLRLPGPRLERVAQVPRRITTFTGAAELAISCPAPTSWSACCLSPRRPAAS